MYLEDVEREVHEWHRTNFPDAAGRPELPLLVVTEEVGELAHATVKEIQAIRGTKAELQEAAKDAVGDIVVALMGYCHVRGWKLTDCLASTWREVSQRTRASLSVADGEARKE